MAFIALSAHLAAGIDMTTSNKSIQCFTKIRLSFQAVVFYEIWKKWCKFVNFSSCSSKQKKPPTYFSFAHMRQEFTLDINILQYVYSLHKISNFSEYILPEADFIENETNVKFILIFKELIFLNLEESNDIQTKK